MTPDLGGALQAVGQLGRATLSGQLQPSVLGDIGNVIKDAPTPAGALAMWEMGPGRALSAAGRSPTFANWVFKPHALEYQGNEPQTWVGELGRAAGSGILGGALYLINRASDVAFLPTLAAGQKAIV